MDNVQSIERVTSKDGTPIAFERRGSGPPLVLVHGTTANRTRWQRISPALEQNFTVVAMDRRGRGDSGDREPYTLEAEFDDVAAVVRAVGQGAFLLGHSYGALCALEAALISPNLRKLVLYEPAFPTDGIHVYAPGTKERFEDLLATGDREQLLTSFFSEIVGVTDAELAALRSDPSWQGRLDAAHTLVRELADEDYVFEEERFRHLNVPVLLLQGELSPEMLKAPTRRLAATLPNCQVVEMKGQAHIAMNTAPELLVREVTRFLQG